MMVTDQIVLLMLLTKFLELVAEKFWWFKTILNNECQFSNNQWLFEFNLRLFDDREPFYAYYNLT